jgi:hypothetical protein
MKYHGIDISAGELTLNENQIPLSKLEEDAEGNITSGDITTSIIKPISDSTSSIRVTKANGTTTVLGVDTVEGNIGIGTSSGTDRLSVLKTVDGDGSISITNLSATSSGRSRIASIADVAAIAMVAASSTSTYGRSLGVANGTAIYTGGNSSGGMAIAARHASGIITFHTGGDTERVRIDAAGNIGIGTSSPNTTLTVASTISTSATGPARTGILLTAASGYVNHFRSQGCNGSTIPAFSAYRSEGTIASPTVVGSGIILGQLVFNGYTGSSWATGGVIYCITSEQWSGTAAGSYLSFNTTTATTQTLTERMRIDASGRVGIGSTPSTTALLQVHGDIYSDIYGSHKFITGNSYSYVTGTYNDDGNAHDHLILSCNYDYIANTIGSASLGTAGIQIIGSNNNGGWILFQSGAKNTAPSTKMCVNPVGYIGIATTSPQTTMTINAGMNPGTAEATYKGILQIQCGTGHITENGGIEFKSAEYQSGYGTRLTSASGASVVGFEIQNRSNSASWRTDMFVKGENGFIGMGNTAPSVPLHITQASAGETIRLTSGSNSAIQFDNSGGTAGEWHFVSEPSATRFAIYSGLYGAGTYRGCFQDDGSFKWVGGIYANGNLVVGYNSATTGNAIEIREGCTTNGYAIIDLVGGTTYPDYGLRIARWADPNGGTQFAHRGTGPMQFYTQESSSIEFWTVGVMRGYFAPDGYFYAVGRAYVESTKRVACGGGTSGNTTKFFRVANDNAGTGATWQMVMTRTLEINGSLYELMLDAVV